jgi:8-oxo-dGTP pyrophosphatase MutT (NUDIX family)
MDNKIRILALAVLQRQDGRILLEKGKDTVKNEVFYRPMGGGVEFGERGEETLIREFYEEIGKSIGIEGFLGTVENIFEWQGKPGHQIILFYKCKFLNLEDYKIEHIPRVDGNPSHSYWKSVAEIEAEQALLHPWQAKGFIKTPVAEDRT